jgi:hypothetical protein
MSQFWDDHPIFLQKVAHRGTNAGIGKNFCCFGVLYPMLTDAQCRNAVCPPDKKQVRFSDSGGLYLQVSPAGSKRWFWKYRIAGVEKQLALSSYPAVILTAARKARDAAKLQKSDGRDPVQARKIAKLKEMAQGTDNCERLSISA